MKQSRIPVSFFPTTLCLVDDNRRFLKNISLQLDEGYAYRLFDNPGVALEYLKITSESESESLLDKYCVVNSEHNSYLNNQYSVNLELDSIHKEIYNKDRFKKVSVVVVDYAMPNMNGLQFCEQLKDSRVKIIMMTAEADHQIAVRAFNDGMIDKFILKSDLNLKETLNRSILELQQKYFYELTEGIASSLASEPNFCLEDPKLIETFEKICRSNNIIEYYLLDTSGSFLLLDASGTPSWFIVKSETELQMYYDFAQDSQASVELCEQIKNGKKIPYFTDINKCYRTTGEEWNEHLYSAKRIDSQEPYYYAYVKNVKDFNLSSQNIFSFEQYIDSLYAFNVRFLTGNGDDTAGKLSTN